MVMNSIILPVGVKHWHMSTCNSVESVHPANGRVHWYFYYLASRESTLVMTN
ncbi:hypothetical protein SLEP1_g17490 [Rubroshorea leprosula]|uniref:Uncharacterized protein n=1 Tax=Rubroshorea leprosula TaxID=152421 RepID=A0AAV5J0A9_9ROSI|nr:hypothetical protein SLEP1_g17490 [Rubroshorea leprosula]